MFVIVQFHSKMHGSCNIKKFRLVTPQSIAYSSSLSYPSQIKENHGIAVKQILNFRS
jgi:hypothetical protein